MKIIIAGSGAMGFHIAELLSKENQDIKLIDIDKDVLASASRHLDIMTYHGDAGSLQVLRESGVEKAELFIAVTTSEKTNLLSAMLAKQLGAKNTIARIFNIEHLGPSQSNIFKKLGVDSLISPDQLAAMEIQRLLQRASFTDLYEFEGGKISIVGVTLDADGPLSGIVGEKFDTLHNEIPFREIALLRGHESFIPDKKTSLRKGDHLYIATPKDHLEAVMAVIGKQLKPVKKVMLIGGTALALRTAQLLEKEFSLTIVLKEDKIGKKFVETLKNSLVILGDPSNFDILKEEGLEGMDAFVALTSNSETNIITNLMAKKLGVYKTIAFVENVNYTHISQSIGIDTIINKKLIAANNIFRFVRKGKVKAIASLHGVDAEIIEFVVTQNKKVVSHTVRELKLPKQSIVAGVIRDKKSFIPGDEFHFRINDKVIILAFPKAIHKIEEIFK